MNTFGEIYRLTTFGESHGPAIGGIIDGMPAGIKVDLDRLDAAMRRRRPGQSDIVTPRTEPDSVEILSGLLDNVTLGTPIGFIIRNTNTRSADYDNLRHTFRPSHADFTYHMKYGGVRDHRGGGRSSARETASRVVGGCLAAQALDSEGIRIHAFTSRVGDIILDKPYTELDMSEIDATPVRCPDEATARAMLDSIRRAKAEGDSLGGVITCIIRGCPPGLGDPVFGKLQARLASAMLSINAAKGFDYGMGFDGVGLKGSQVIDRMRSHDGRPGFLSNHSGGIQGGISNGEDICFRVAFKPVATILRPVETIDDSFHDTILQARGRHDPCVLPRAVPIVEAMAAMVIMDSLLINRSARF